MPVIPITPIPGIVGPIIGPMLTKNTLIATKNVCEVLNSKELGLPTNYCGGFFWFREQYPKPVQDTKQVKRNVVF